MCFRTMTYFYVSFRFVLEVVYGRGYLGRRIVSMVFPFFCVVLNMFTTKHVEKKVGCPAQVKLLYTAGGFGRKNSFDGTSFFFVLSLICLQGNTLSKGFI